MNDYEYENLAEAFKEWLNSQRQKPAYREAYVAGFSLALRMFYDEYNEAVLQEANRFLYNENRPEKLASAFLEELFEELRLFRGDL
jgi:hypothetical protein